MDEDEKNFEAWQICWNVNMLLHARAVNNRQKTCLFCNKALEFTGKLCSEFALVAAECSAKHSGSRIWHQAVGVCAECDVDLVQRITERRQLCFQDGCLRFMVVNIDEVRTRIAGRDPGLFEKYLELVMKNRHYTCAVCCSDVEFGDGPSRAPTTSCQHDPSYCSECLASYIRLKVRNHEWHNIQCSEQGCEASLSGRDVAEFADADTFKAYDEHKTFANLSKNPNFRWCSKQCGNGEIVTIKCRKQGYFSSRDPVESNWRCRKCGNLNCFNCKAGHVGETCDEYKRNGGRTNDSEFEMRKISKRCPKRGCGRYVRKESGCSHMVCGRQSDGCGTRFCWKCKIIFQRRPGGTSDQYGSYVYKHAVGCHMLNGRYEASGMVPKPGNGDPLYRDNWDQDPDYIAGDSDTERWR